MRILTSLILTFALTGCGAIYTSPAVRSGVTDASKVRMLPITAETVLVANRSAFRPETLPAIFSRTAGTGGNMPTVAALPAAALQAQNRPASLEMRLPPAPASGPYLIGVGDVVLLATPQVGGTVEELSGLLAAQNRRQGYTVQDDGAIAIPDVGRIRLAGLTLEEAEAEVFQRLVENQIDPAFSLEISEFNSRSVAIGGAVKNPINAPIRLMPLYLDQALAAAGGVTVADSKYATIRLYREGALYQIPLAELYARPGLQKIRLLDRDSLFVDTEYELAQAQAYFDEQIRLSEFRQRARQTALAELSSEIALRRAELQEGRANYNSRLELGAVARDYVYLTGEVASQRRFALPFEQRATLADALFDQGGGIPTETGDVSRIYVLRGASDPREFGAITAWQLDASNAANLFLATRFELRPNDIIFVAEQPVTRWGRVVRQITPSLITTPASVAARN